MDKYLNGLNLTVILAGVVGYLAMSLKQIPSKICKFIVERHSYFISVSTQYMHKYNKLADYLLKEKPIKILNRNILYNTFRSTNSIAYGDYIFFIDKFTLAIVSSSQREKGQDSIDYLSIRVFGLFQKKYRDEIINYINREERIDNSKISIFENDIFVSRETKRTFDTIFIKDKQKLINYIDSFISNKAIYDKFSARYKTGILLYGEPGTGKSSIAYTIASYLNYKLKIVDLSSFKVADDFKNTIVSGLEENTVCLFEDIDTMITNRDDPTKKNPMLGILLNVLDGILSPSDVIFIATTNYIDRLDSALIRSGRFDFKIELTNYDKELAEEMCKGFEAPLSILDNESFPINPSYLQNKIFTYKKDIIFNKVQSKDNVVKAIEDNNKIHNNYGFAKVKTGKLINGKLS